MEKTKRTLSNMKLKRLLRCYTQQQVAEWIGITREYYDAVENGRSKITGNILMRLAKFYDCPQKELI